MSDVIVVTVQKRDVSALDRGRPLRPILRFGTKRHEEGGVAVLVLSQHTAKFLLFFPAKLKLYSFVLSPVSPLPSPPPKTKMADSDLFDGAIGIDLGTTYSYVSLIVTALHTSRLVQLRGRMAK